MACVNYGWEVVWIDKLLLRPLLHLQGTLETGKLEDSIVLVQNLPDWLGVMPAFIFCASIGGM